jgi:hypothetical protein
MNKNKKLLVIGLTSLLLASCITAYAFVYFSRTITHNFRVVGIAGELLVPSLDGYVNKNIATDLTNEKVAVVIYAENFFFIWMNVTTYHDVQNLVLTVSGQYYDIWYSEGVYPNPPIQHFEPLGESFSFVNGTSQTVDKTKMMWTPITGLNIHAYCLVLTFVFDCELGVYPGDYSANLLVQMGFV